jgi:plasmid stabilization system protein ParE
LLTYVTENFSRSAAARLLEKIDAKSLQVAKYPEIGQKTRYKTVRRLRVNKRLSFFYRVHGRKIFILFLWDNKQHPGRNPYR